MKIRSYRVFSLTLPYRHGFRTALGSRRISRNVGFEVRVGTNRRTSLGYGEASTSLAFARLTAIELFRTVKRLGAWSVGKEAGRALVLEAWTRFGQAPPAVSAFESAVLAALAAAQGTSPAALLGGVADRVETDVTVSAWEPPAAGRFAQAAALDGFKAFKVKVGTGRPGEDLRRVLEVRRAGGRRILLDGNQGLSPAGALHLVEACLKKRVRIDLLEQPVRKEDWKGLAYLKRRCPVPVAIDESLQTPQDALRALDLDAADVFNIKLAKSGILRGLEIMDLARAGGKKLMIGCMAESARGLSASVHLACGTGAFDYVDLDSDYLLEEPQPKGDFLRRGPFLSL